MAQFIKSGWFMVHELLFNEFTGGFGGKHG